MGLEVDYRDQGCSGTFHVAVELPPAVGAAAVLALVAAVGVVVGWTADDPLMPVFLFGVGALAVLIRGSELGSLIAEPLLSFAPVSRRVASFRVVSGWLEVRRGGQTERVYLPRARVSLHGRRLRVASTTTPVRVEILGARGDEEALRLLARSLEEVGRHDTGRPSEVPDGLRQLTGAARERTQTE